MKKLIIIAAAFLFIGAAASAQGPKFAHVNFNELVQLMPEMDSARVQMDASQKEIQDTYQSMIEEFNSKYAEYGEKQATWTQSVRESKEREIQSIQARIQEFEQSSQQDLAQLQNTLMAPIYQKAQDVVNNLAKAQDAVPETAREHYASLTARGGDCIACGACEKRCPFGVSVIKNMSEAKKIFGN